MAAKGKPPARRKRVSNNPSRVAPKESLRITKAAPRHKLPSAEELFALTEPTLAVGKRTPATQITSLPSAEELFARTEPGGDMYAGQDSDEQPELQAAQFASDTREYLSPPRSIDPDRPRAREVFYDRQSKVLHVVFRDGGTYDYFDVPHQTWGALKKASSFGQAFDRLVLNYYKFQKVSS